MREGNIPQGAEAFRADVPMGGPERVTYLQDQRRALEEWQAHKDEPNHEIKMPGSDKTTTIGAMAMTEEEYQTKLRHLNEELSQKTRPE